MNILFSPALKLLNLILNWPCVLSVLLPQISVHFHQKQVGAERQAITSIFKDLHKYLQERELFCLTQLVELEKGIKKRQQENITKLSKKITHFSKLIKDVEVKYQQTPGKFLQVRFWIQMPPRPVNLDHSRSLVPTRVR